MKDLIRGIKVNIIGNLFRFSRLGFFITATVLYGTELFGVYTVAWATSELLNRYGMLGLEHGMLFELAHFHNTGEHRKLYQKITSSLKACLFISVLGATVLLVYAYLFIEESTQVRNSLYILIPVIPFYNVGVLLIQATMGLKDMKYHAIIRSGLEPLAMLIFLLIFWITPFRAYGIVLAQAAALLLVVLASVITFRRFFSWREVFRTWKRPGRYLAIIKYSLPMYIIEAVDTTLYRMDIFLLSAVLGTGNATQLKLLGVYGFAKHIARVITQTKNAFVPIFVPVSSETYLKNDSSELWNQVRFAMEKLFLLNIAFGLFLTFFGHDILGIVGKDVSLMPLSAFLCLLGGQFLYSTFSVVMFFLVTTQRSMTFLISEIIILAICAASGLYLVKYFQAIGAAAVVGSGYAVIMTIAVLQTIRYHAKDFMTKHTFRVIFAGTITAFLMYFLKKIAPSDWPALANMIGITIVSLTVYLSLTTTRSQWRSLIKW